MTTVQISNQSGFNQPSGKRSLASRFKAPTPMLLSVVAAALLAGPAAQAAVYSTTPLHQYDGKGIFAASSVRCSVTSDPLIIRQMQEGGEWCAKDHEGVCGKSKLTAAQKACNYRAPREADAASLLAKVETPKAAPVAAAPKIDVAMKDSLAKKAAANSLALEKGKLSIEAKRITIEQQKLNLRKEELELQKQELNLKQASTEQ